MELRVLIGIQTAKGLTEDYIVINKNTMVQKDITLEYKGFKFNYEKYLLFRLCQQFFINHKLEYGYFRDTIVKPTVSLEFKNKSDEILFSTYTTCDYDITYEDMNQYDFTRVDTDLPDIYQYIWDFIDDIVEFTVP
jgi:hypothetical protein